MTNRTIVISDVHGCVGELQDLLSKVAYVPEDRLVFVGDLVDKGPNPLGALRLAQGLGAEMVLGNHEDRYLQYHYHLLHKKGQLPWGKTGNLWADKPTMKPEHLAFFDQLDPFDFEFLEECPHFMSLGVFDGEDVAVVHGGLEATLPLDQQDPSNVMRCRWVDSKGGYLRGFERPANGVRWTHKWRGPQSVIYGHAVRSYDHITVEGTPKHKKGFRTYGIDTGCVYGGRLTALILPGFEVVSVKAKIDWFTEPNALSLD